MAARRLPSTLSLTHRLREGAEGGKEFARIVNLLLIHDVRRHGHTLTHVDDAAGDYAGLDAIAESDDPKSPEAVGYQYKFYPSPLSASHRAEIKKALQDALAARDRSGITRWVIVTPDDLVESATRVDNGDVTWFKKLQDDHRKEVVVEHYGHSRLVDLFLAHRPLCLLYHPDLVVDGRGALKTIEATRKAYDANLANAIGRIKFVGMSIRTEEAARGVEMEKIYIPLRLTRETNEPAPGGGSKHIDPATLRAPGQRAVILGDPGSGKSTLLRFLALVGGSEALQKRSGVSADAERLPIFVTLKEYADELKARPTFPLIDFLVQSTQGDFSLKAADLEFLEFYLDTGRALLCFDGLDELPNPEFKRKVRDRIEALLETYPGNTCLVTSRVVGYDQSFRFGDTFDHYRVAPLDEPAIERFVTDWYAVREPNKPDREANIKHLVSVIKSPEQEAIATLARNPLLLTIMALVHRVDQVLPDVRVELYHRCTETLLNTWHTWRWRDADETSRNRAERRNRERIEALACWMQELSASTEQVERAIVRHDVALRFLTVHIQKNEHLKPDSDPEEEAERFLDFVRNRAGLLVEVGDRQYGFVHLTFQEYLTATQMKRAAELGGAADLWGRMLPHLQDDRWEETFRLLVAGLDSGASRAYILGRVLELARELPSVNLASLLLGCFIDRIEEAEHVGAEIFAATMLAIERVATDREYHRLSTRLHRSLRSAEDRSRLVQAAQDRVGANSPEQRRAIVLFLGQTEARAVMESRPEGWAVDASDVWLRILVKERLQLTQREVDLARPGLDQLLRDLAIVNVTQEGPYLSAPTVAVAFLLGPEVGEYYLVRNLLSQKNRHSFFSLRWPNLLHFRALDFAGITESEWPKVIDWDRYRRQGSGRHIRLASALKQVLANREFLEPRSWLSVVPWYASKSGATTEIAASSFQRARIAAGVLQSREKRARTPSQVPNALVCPGVKDQLIDSLGLTPPHHWRFGFLFITLDANREIPPLDPARVNALLEGGPIEGKEDLLGSLLLLDSELFMLRHFERPDDSHMRALADKARASSNPVLRLVSCLRDLSHGDASRTDDLRKMVLEPAPEMRVLLDQCLWFPPDPNDPELAKLRRQSRRMLDPLDEPDDSPSADDPEPTTPEPVAAKPSRTRPRSPKEASTRAKAKRSGNKG